MDNLPTEPNQHALGWRPKHAYVLAATCLVLGFVAGYLLRGSESPARSAALVAKAEAVSQRPTLDQMKHMADESAKPLLAQLTKTPNDDALLVKIGNVYQATHQFSEAAAYYQKALSLRPGNVAARTELASCLYYKGDADGAIEQLQLAVRDNPRNASSLFNLGLLKWKEKKDAAAALSAWGQLLRSNPELPDSKKAEVRKLMADIRKNQTEIKTPKKLQ